jgi:hypothetical protein
MSGHLINPDKVEIKFSLKQLWWIGGVVVGATIFLTTLYVEVRSMRQSLTSLEKQVEPIPELKRDVADLKTQLQRVPKSIP